MAFNCTISTNDDAMHPDGTRYVHVTIQGKAGSGAPSLAQMIGEFYTRRNMIVRIVMGPDNHPMLGTLRHTPQPQVLITVQQDPR
jgi:hypothetical protein